MMLKTDNWDNLPEESKIWIYQANKTMKSDEGKSVFQLSSDFVQAWDSHGVELNSGAALFYDRFLVLAAAPENNPGGCSIDSMNAFVKSISAKYGIDFFDRMNVVYKDADGNLSDCNLNSLSELKKSGEIDSTTIVFDNLISTKSLLDSKWELKIEDSWHNRFLD